MKRLEERVTSLEISAQRWRVIAAGAATLAVCMGIVAPGPKAAAPDEVRCRRVVVVDATDRPIAEISEAVEGGGQVTLRRYKKDGTGVDDVSWLSSKDLYIGGEPTSLRCSADEVHFVQNAALMPCMRILPQSIQLIQEVPGGVYPERAGDQRDLVQKIREWTDTAPALWMAPQMLCVGREQREPVAIVGARDRGGYVLLRDEKNTSRMIKASNLATSAPSPSK